MTHKLSILLVEDEKNICDFISTSLSAQDYRISTAHTGKEALPIITSQCPDLILLDLGLPDMDGMEIIRQVRTWSSVPIIVLSARTQEQEKVRALDLGADDYLTKPFNILELKARIKALLRRSGALDAKKNRITAGELTVDTQERNVYKNGHPVELTAREFDLVELLMRNPNRVYSRENLLDLIWGYDEYRSDIRTVDVHIRRIREKLETNPAEPRYFMTKWGVGYYFKA